MERKMKDSGIPWIGQIPEHWEITQLAKICYEHYVTNKIEHNQNLLSLSYGNIKRKDINTADGLLPASFDTYQIVENGNIVLRLTDLQNDKKSLRVGHVGERGIITSAYVALGMKSYAYSKYLYFLLHTADICKVFYSFGGGVRQSGKWDDLASLIVPLPPLSEQESIATYLDKKCGEIDELIEVEQQMISDLESYRQSVITEAVTHGLNTDAPLRDSGIPWIGQVPEHWIVTKSKFYITISSGDSLSKEDITSEGDFPVYGGGEIIGFYRLSNVSKGTIIIGRVGARCGCITMVEDDSWATDNALIVKTNQNFRYFSYLLRGANLNQLNESNAQPLITATKVKEVSITIPPLAEQQEIADYLDAKCAEIDELIKVKQEKIETLKQYRQSLIFEAVTGKTLITINA